MIQLEYQKLLEKAAYYTVEYIKQVDEMPPFPSQESLMELEHFEEDLPNESSDAEQVLEQLHTYGAKNTTAMLGSRYFGFVNGGLLPVAHAAQWLVDTWNQNGALHVMSPVTSKLEQQCERWMIELLGLPLKTAMGIVSGSSNALICALAAARNELLHRQGYELSEKGLRNAPAIRVVMSTGVHSSVKAALSVLGIGSAEVETVPVDQNGCIIPTAVPKLDSHTLLILQAGNVSGGGFDAINELCELARDVGAWVHIDGAFGLWAAASHQYRHLVVGLEKADSWSLDAHKTLNAGYDCGILLCRDRKALTCALQANGSYVQYSEQRDGMLYTTEMSRRARSVVLWAVLKQLGAKGVEELVDALCENAAYFAAQLKKIGFSLKTDCFNQAVVQCGTSEQTHEVLQKVQNSEICWCSGCEWNNSPAIRISVCSYRTTKEDIDRSVSAFETALKAAGGDCNGRDKTERK